MSMVQAHPGIEKIAAETNGVVDGIPVREIIREVFRNPDHGTPDNISKAGCLALALRSNEAGGLSKGHLVWNLWRKYFPPADVAFNTTSRINCPDFSGVSIKNLNFRKFDLNRADFSKCIFNSVAEFSCSILGGVNFCSAKFQEEGFFNDAEISSSKFDDVDFSYRASFTGATFTGPTSFTGMCAVGGAVDFSNIRCVDTFGRCTLDFSGAYFSEANFTGVDFPHGVTFRSATFRTLAQFRQAKFGGTANFIDARFGPITHFRAALFMADALFLGCKFQGLVDFCGAIFPHAIDFSACVFLGKADFGGMSWGEFGKSMPPERLDSYKHGALQTESGPDIFYRLSLLGAQFNDESVFSNRKFKDAIQFGLFRNIEGYQAVRLSPDRRPLRSDQGELILEELPSVLEKTSFAVPPIFHNADIHPATSFEEVVFTSTGQPGALRAYCTLKQVFSKQQVVREEQRFFRLEMKEEALRERGLKRLLFRAYETFADYGFSITRPLKYGSLGVLVLTLVYGFLSWAGQCGFSVGAGCSFAPQWIEFSLLQTLPLPGLEKLSETARGEFWPVGLWWGVVLSLLVIIHKTLSLAALFLVGLALRNLFKFK